jgi:glycogen operon protein
VDTARPEGVPAGSGRKAVQGDRLELADRSVVVLQRPA